MSADGEQGGVLASADDHLIGLLRREGRHSGVWFSHHLLTAADRLEGLTAATATDTPDAATIALCATIVSEEGPQNPESDWTDYARARGSMRDRILKRFAALAKHPASPEDAA